MQNNKIISIAYGDGIGPEIMEATLSILKEAGAKIHIETIDIGEKIYLKGNSSGIPKDTWDVLKRTKILLKAPITTPQGKGYKSLNVTLRKTLGLYANIRPAISYYPYVASNCKKMDMVIVRENEEDLYAGIEYVPSHNFALCYKIITHRGSEKIIRYAFEYAKKNNRKKVTCLVKDNIMKISDGMFHKIFDDIAKEYTSIEANSMIIDIGAARIAARPEDFDIIVTLNFYGDVVSDIAAEVSGSVGLAGSSNIGNDFAMFEAVHGSAPDIAGKNIANPSGLLNAAILMLEYIDQKDVASKVKNAWLKTIEDGIHTADIYKEGISKQKVSTAEFSKAVIMNLGKEPEKLPKAVFVPTDKNDDDSKASSNNKHPEQKLIGVDVYIQCESKSIEELAGIISDLHSDLKLHLISYRGLKVWPDEDTMPVKPELICCRFIGFRDSGVTQKTVIELLIAINDKSLEVALTSNLYMYDNQVGFTLAQGE
jgi:isocitrate dehydrogenase